MILKNQTMIYKNQTMILSFIAYLAASVPHSRPIHPSSCLKNYRLVPPQYTAGRSGKKQEKTKENLPMDKQGLFFLVFFCFFLFF